MPINDSITFFPVVTTVAAAHPAVSTFTLPAGGYVPMPACTCNHTWSMSGSQIGEQVRRPAFGCPQHAPQPETVNDGTCSTCGK
jgi:hypothetical protein